eukprot:scaffold59947_cov73-Cyclotella_meneghiniana.AAC.1
MVCNCKGKNVPFYLLQRLWLWLIGLANTWEQQYKAIPGRMNISAIVTLFGHKFIRPFPLTVLWGTLINTRRDTSNITYGLCYS